MEKLLTQKDGIEIFEDWIKNKTARVDLFSLSISEKQKIENKLREFIKNTSPSPLNPEGKEDTIFTFYMISQRACDE